MAKLLHLFAFDFKLLRYFYSFPFVAYAVCAGLMLIIGVQSESSFTSYLFVQGIAVPMAGWHLVFLYSSLYEEGAKETLIGYYRKVLVIDVLRYALLHGVFIFFLALLTEWISESGFFTGTLLLHLFLLFIFYQLVGIALLSMTHSLELTLAILATYTFMEVGTQGTFMPWPHVFLFMDPGDDIWLWLTFISLVTGILLSVIQLWRKFR